MCVYPLKCLISTTIIRLLVLRADAIILYSSHMLMFSVVFLVFLMSLARPTVFFRDTEQGQQSPRYTDKDLLCYVRHYGPV